MLTDADNKHSQTQAKQQLDKHMYTRYSHTIMLTDASKFETNKYGNLPTHYPQLTQIRAHSADQQAPVTAFKEIPSTC